MGMLSPVLSFARFRVLAPVMVLIYWVYEVIVTFTDIDRGWKGRRRP